MERHHDFDAVHWDHQPVASHAQTALKAANRIHRGGLNIIFDNNINNNSRRERILMQTMDRLESLIFFTLQSSPKP